MNLVSFTHLLIHSVRGEILSQTIFFFTKGRVVPGGFVGGWIVEGYVGGCFVEVLNIVIYSL